MRKYKKLLSIAIILCMLIQFLGCKTNTNTKDFDEYINNVHLKMYENDYDTPDYMFKDKTSVGFNDVGRRYRFPSKESYDDSMKIYENILKELKSFNYYQLSDEQKLNYDILEDYAKRFLACKDDYEFDFKHYTYISDSFLYSQKQVFDLKYEDKQDFDLYLQILKETNESFDDLCNICEYLMQNNLISKEDIETIISNCRDDVICVGIEDKIEKSTLYTDKEKKQYLSKYNELIKEYKNLTALSKAKIQKLYDTYKGLLNNESKEKVSTLYKTQKGKNHYKHQLQMYIDPDVDSVEKLMAEIKLSAAKTKAQLDKLCKETGMKPSYDDTSENVKYCDFNSKQQVMDYLEENYSKYFPKLPKLEYTLNVGLPAGVCGQFVPPLIDAPFENLAIYVSSDYTNTSYHTLAHEGLPGHMLQIMYNYLSDVPTFRKMIFSQSYTEGWADYIEKYILNYLPIEDNRSAKVHTLSVEYERYIRCLLDIYVNYYGWNYDQFKEYYIRVIGREDNGYFSLEKLYDNIVEYPALFTFRYPVYGGYFEDLYNSTKLVLGDKFDPVEFHKVILDCAQGSIKIIRKQVNKYIAKKLLES